MQEVTKYGAANPMLSIDASGQVEAVESCFKHTILMQIALNVIKHKKPMKF